MIYTGSYFTLPKDFKGLKIQISNSKPKWFQVDMAIPQLYPDQTEGYFYSRRCTIINSNIKIAGVIL